MTRWGRVNKILKPGGACHHVGLYASHGDLLKLLDAEHRAVVRLVQRLKNTKGHSRASLCQPAYQLACDDILTALAKRKGG